MSGYKCNRNHSLGVAHLTPALGATLFALCGVAMAQQPETSATAATGATTTAPTNAPASTDTEKQKKKRNPLRSRRQAYRLWRKAQPIDDSAASPSASGRVPSSTEQGQSPLDESFAPRTHEEWVRRPGARPGRTPGRRPGPHLLPRPRQVRRQPERGLGLGGSVGAQDRLFPRALLAGRDRLHLDRLHGPDDKDGTLLLKPGQHGYAVLGELYGDSCSRPTRG